MHSQTDLSLGLTQKQIVKLAWVRIMFASKALQKRNQTSREILTRCFVDIIIGIAKDKAAPKIVDLSTTFVHNSLFTCTKQTANVLIWTLRALINSAPVIFYQDENFLHLDRCMTRKFQTGVRTPIKCRFILQNSISFLHKNFV